MKYSLAACAHVTISKTILRKAERNYNTEKFDTGTDKITLHIAIYFGDHHKGKYQGDQLWNNFSNLLPVFFEVESFIRSTLFGLFDRRPNVPERPTFFNDVEKLFLLAEEAISESDEYSRGDGLLRFARSLSRAEIGRRMSAAIRSLSSTADTSPNIAPNRFANFSPSASLTCLNKKTIITGKKYNKKRIGKQ
uniref:Uncharacterized protein n=1 Tax=Parascaris equorum TaxID=6256 RepID=A0A914R5S1_PAREQ